MSGFPGRRRSGANGALQLSWHSNTRIRYVTTETHIAILRTFRRSTITVRNEVERSGEKVVVRIE